MYQPSILNYSQRLPPLSKSRSSDEIVRLSVYAVQRWRRLLIDITAVQFYGLDLFEVYETNFFELQRELEDACSLCFDKEQARTATYFKGSPIWFDKQYTIPDIIDVKHCEYNFPARVTSAPPASGSCQRNQQGQCDNYGPLYS